MNLRLNYKALNVYQPVSYKVLMTKVWTSDTSKDILSHGHSIYF